MIFSGSFQFRQRIVLALAITFVLTIGCGKSYDGPTRYQVSGKVTYRNQPVPKGFIRFVPDTSQANRGPGGGAPITDGKYATPERQSIVGALTLSPSRVPTAYPTANMGKKSPMAGSCFQLISRNSTFPRKTLNGMSMCLKRSDLTNLILRPTVKRDLQTSIGSEGKSEGIPRLRVIVETDAGGDPDDEQSMVRFLLYSNEWDVEGIICARPKAREKENLNSVRTGLGIVQRMVKAYGECYPNLTKHGGSFRPCHDKPPSEERSLEASDG